MNDQPREIDREWKQLADELEDDAEIELLDDDLVELAHDTEL